ncbi:PREDICTED: uncharacterized protein C1071.11-like isoform X2 [Priapulus caudatus]|uniref:Uncharacterized protein C1071.11-like isoform X2 n=1 Tax=Priapulus caudatus TaxID=37621 RepID=A0ABM1E2I2_PRICU|nr:PREDICTED: uncharacterized protein C1071.11-like isoform X2 [Priapulus caudatus]
MAAPIRKYITCWQFQHCQKSSHSFSLFTAFRRLHLSTRRCTLSKPNEETVKEFQAAMRSVPSPVVVVTAAEYDQNAKSWYKRGATCGSFSSMSMAPPIVSFNIRHPSRFHNLVKKTQKFTINVLTEDQAHLSLHFAKRCEESEDQFADVPHMVDAEGNVLLDDMVAIILCTAHGFHTVGDHYLWLGNVAHAWHYKDAEPLLYWRRKYRSLGDETFIKAFEERTLPYEWWNHEAHLRMAWNYILEYGKEDAIPLVKTGIKNYNEKNKDKVRHTHGYHETITMFYLEIINHSIRQQECSKQTFEEFIDANKDLLDRQLPLKYYAENTLFSPEAKIKFVAPDKKPLPS